MTSRPLFPTTLLGLSPPYLLGTGHTDHSGTCLREENITEQLDQALASLKLDTLDLDLLHEECRALFADFTAGQEKEMKALHLNLAQIEERVGRLTDAYIDSVIDKS